MSWRVLPDGRCVPISETEDLISDAQALIEDLQQLVDAATQTASESRELVASVRRSRRRRETRLRLVRGDPS